jgi:UbiD family decarboxylase
MEEKMEKSYQDLTEFVQVLEDQGQLVRVKTEVDKDWEISTVTRHTCRLAPGYPARRPALLYENVKGFDIPVLLGAFASEKRVAMSLGIFEKDEKEMRKKLRAKFSDAYNYKCEPKMVKKGPCQDNVFVDDAIDLFKLPIPTWSLGKDAGPYITAGGTLSKDPETGERSVGNYRIQLKGKNRLGIYPTEGHDCWRHWRKLSKQNKPLPVAVLVGTNGPVLFPQCFRVPYDELQLAGGFDRGPIEVVKCKTNDLEVPATTQIVIEGEMPPNYLEDEGPFGEAFGVVCPIRKNPVIEVKAVSYRNDPIYEAFMSSGVPGTASATRESFKPYFQLANLEAAGVTDIVDLYMSEAGTGSQITIVSINKLYEFHPRDVMDVLWASKEVGNKIVIVTDADVNVREWFEVYRALFQRVEPSRDVVIRESNSYEVDPSPRPGGSLTTGKLGIDATMPYDYNFSLPENKYFVKVAREWKKYGIKLID